MDWFTRKVLAWRISNTLEAEFCVAALNEAIHKFGPPEIMNTDQGSQFTSFDWTDRLKRAKTKISMDGKARYLDSMRRPRPIGLSLARRVQGDGRGLFVAHNGLLDELISSGVACWAWAHGISASMSLAR